jgi:hypothetical protein
MREPDVILPNMRGASVQVGSQVHALFLPNASKPEKPTSFADIRAEFARRVAAETQRSNRVSAGR